MGLKNADHPAKSVHRITANVPAVNGDYASERITIGAPAGGEARQSFMGTTALIEGTLSGVTLELWLPRVPDGSKDASAFTDADYFFSGVSLATTGMVTQALAGWPGAQWRVKSGGSAGQLPISATAF